MAGSIHRRLTIAAAGAALLAGAGLLVAGCGSGQIAATARNVPAIPGADVATSGPDGLLRISVHDAVIDYPGVQGYPAGGNAPMTMRIVNSSQQALTLEGATATARGGLLGGVPSGTELGTVVLSGGPAVASNCGQSPGPATTPSPALATPSPTATTPSPPTTGRPTASASRRSPAGSASAGAPSASPSPSAAPSPSPAGESRISVRIPAQCLIVLGKAGGGPYLQITNLRAALRPGDLVHIELRFRFADGSQAVLGGNNDFDVPVTVPSGALPRVSPSLSPAED